jgi:hypothetical protein
MIDERPYTRDEIRDTLKLKRPENKVSNYEIPQYKGQVFGNVKIWNERGR